MYKMLYHVISHKRPRISDVIKSRFGGNF